MFKKICHSDSIDGILITEKNRQDCLQCELPTCDQNVAPACQINCGRSICVGGVQTYEAAACSDIHPKNVAKCCMFGGEHCSCMRKGYIDVSDATMKEIEKRGSTEVEWYYGKCKKHVMPKKVIDPIQAAADSPRKCYKCFCRILCWCKIYC